jgi:hypothetical protein
VLRESLVVPRDSYGAIAVRKRYQVYFRFMNDHPEQLNQRGASVSNIGGFYDLDRVEMH